MAIMPFKVTSSSTNRKLICNFLLVININLHSIWHHFQVIMDYWLNFCIRQGGGLFNTLIQGNPLNSRVWNLASRIALSCGAKFISIPWSI